MEKWLQYVSHFLDLFVIELPIFCINKPNRCSCHENGFSSCTLMLCLNTNEVEGIEGVKDRKKRFIEEKCVPGTTFKRDCNTCRCTASGIAACTKKGC